MIRCGYHGALCKSASGCMNVFLCVYYPIEHAVCIDFAHVHQSVMLQAGGSTEPQPPIHSARNALKTNKNANERDSFLHCFSVRIQFVYVLCFCVSRDIQMLVFWNEWDFVRVCV